MKVVSPWSCLLSLLLLSLSHDVVVVDAIRCGTPLTTACLGDTDIRYDPDASDVITDQAVLWNKLSGLYMGMGTARGNALEVLVGPVPAFPDPSVPVVALPYFDFINVTFDGSRAYFISYYVAPFSPTNEKTAYRLTYATSSYERDGSIVALGGILDDRLPEGEPLIPSGMRGYPVDENTMYFSTRFSGIVDGVGTQLIVCLDVDCNQFMETSNAFTISNNTGNVIRVSSFEGAFLRVNSTEAWYQAIYDRYNNSNIPLNERLDPTIDICTLGLCPSEQEWCETDPECSVSPFQEPPASVRGDVIAGFTVGGVVLLVAVLYAIHRYLLFLQAKRYRAIFAKRIAETIEVQGSMRALPPDALVEEFQRIDAITTDGKLSKEELWEFISSGKAGEMHRKDFDALFAAIDLDASGSIDFLEFCAFMGQCSDEYRAARVDRGAVVARSSRRLSVANTAARRLSEMSSTFVSKQISIPEEEEMEFGDEGGEGKEEEEGEATGTAVAQASFRRQSAGLQAQPK